MNHALYHRDCPPLATFQTGAEDPLCAFCAHEDLRVCDREASTYLGCPKCGADGPVAVGGKAAVSAYTNRVEVRI